jgi:hypothetical protein
MLWLKPDSTQNYSSNKHLSFSCMLSIKEYSSKLSMRWEMPSSTQNYSSNKHLGFSCMLNIMKYSNRLNMNSLTPSSTRYCIARKVKNYYKVNTMPISLNRQCKLWLKPSSNQNYSSNKHLSFSCMLNIMKY